MFLCPYEGLWLELLAPYIFIWFIYIQITGYVQEFPCEKEVAYF